jgi:2-phosphoglycerate kinase
MSHYYLIGGAPLTGKSTITQKLEGYVTVPTDDVRTFLQNILKVEENPELFYDHGLDAVAFYDKYKDAKTVFAHELRQAEATQRGVDALMKSNFPWDKIAIEGIAITPAYVDKIRTTGEYDMEWMFLYDDDVNRIRQRIYDRGLYDDADKYPDEIKEIEVEWVVMYNEFYKSECVKYGFDIQKV